MLLQLLMLSRWLLCAGMFTHVPKSICVADHLLNSFATRSLRFMDAYRKRLTGKQAAWANKKYRGHRVLPNELFDALAKAGI